MNNLLLKLSKTFYILSFATLFLPTFIPSCSSEMESAICSDTITTISSSDTLIKIDSASHMIDTIVSAQPVESKKEKVSSEVKSIWQPDGQNFSFWGYMLISFNDGMIWIFVASLFYGGILKFMNRNHTTSAVLSLVGFFCLTAINKNKVVWGFWIVYGVYLILTITNWICYFQERRKLLLNKL